MAALTLMNAPQVSPHAERAHAMKNCLGVITMVAELLRKEASQTDHERLERLRRAASRLCSLLEADLVEDTEPRGHSLSKQTSCSVDTLVRSVVDTVADRAENANVYVAFDCEGGQIEGDQAALSECLLNLLVNAIDASRAGGVVCVSTQITGRGDQVWTVRDDGRGIAVDQLQELGRPQSSRTRGGWGIGLAVVQHTITDHGGVLHVQSREHAGTTFTIWLPRKRG